MDTIKVVCGIIFHDNKIFVCRRKPGKSLSGFWEFPGGKIEENETRQESLARELIEELDMQVSINNFIGTSVHDYGTFKIELLGYKCTLVNYEGKLTDHDKYDWIKPENLLTKNLAPADIPLAEIIINEQL